MGRGTANGWCSAPSGGFAAASGGGLGGVFRDPPEVYYVPEIGAFLIYLVMVGLLMWRPAGLFGRR